MPFCAHGTARDLSYLMPGNARPKIKSCWSCSDQDSFVYVWNLDSFAEHGEVEEDCDVLMRQAVEEGRMDDVPSIGYSLFRHALDSAQTQAAFEGKDGLLTVLLLDIPWSALTADLSCPNMEMASRFRPVMFDPSWIVGVYTQKFYAYYSPFIIAPMVSNSFFNAEDCDPMLLRLAKTVGDSSLDHYDIIEECCGVDLLEYSSAFSLASQPVLD